MTGGKAVIGENSSTRTERVDGSDQSRGLHEGTCFCQGSRNVTPGCPCVAGCGHRVSAFGDVACRAECV